MSLHTRGYAAPRTPSFRTERKPLLASVLRKGSAIRGYDWILLADVVVLSLLGTLLVYSATQPSADPRGYLIKQLINVALGLVFMVAVSLLEYRQIRLFAPIVYALACLGLAIVLSPLGSTVSGAKSWINLPGNFQIEPSEYAKLGLILLTALIFSEVRESRQNPRLRDVGLVLGCAMLPVIMVVLQPDLGVTILMLVVAGGMIALSGLPLRWLGALAALGVIGVIAVFQLHLLKGYQLTRLTAFLHPSVNPSSSGYETLHSKIMIGSGRTMGTGLLHGPLVTAGFVPNQQTDFIFSVAGEELGFAGAAMIIALTGVLVFRALRIASRADDQFGTLVAAGIAIWFGVQSFINIGMTIGIMPVTGLPLPFVSYGGSAMFADMIAIGMLQSVHRRHSVFS